MSEQYTIDEPPVNDARPDILACRAHHNGGALLPHLRASDAN